MTHTQQRTDKGKKQHVSIKCVLIIGFFKYANKNMTELNEADSFQMEEKEIE